MSLAILRKIIVIDKTIQNIYKYKKILSIIYCLCWDRLFKNGYLFILIDGSICEERYTKKIY